MIDNFQAFNITFIQKEKNHREESLVVSASMFILDDFENKNSFKVSTLYQHVVPNNEEALQVVENDDQTHFFFAGSEEEEENDLTIEKKKRNGLF